MYATCPPPTLPSYGLSPPRTAFIGSVSQIMCDYAMSCGFLTHSAASRKAFAVLPFFVPMTSQWYGLSGCSGGFGLCSIV